MQECNLWRSIREWSSHSRITHSDKLGRRCGHHELAIPLSSSLFHYHCHLQFSKILRCKFFEFLEKNATKFSETSRLDFFSLKIHPNLGIRCCLSRVHKYGLGNYTLENLNLKAVGFFVHFSPKIRQIGFKAFTMCDSAIYV